jgi:hypothetical protein
MMTGASDGLALRYVGLLRRVGWQVGARCVDGGLYLARGGVDVAVEVELQRHARRAVATVGRHLVHTGNHTQAPLQRRGHAAGHGLGAGTGQAGADRDDGEVHLRQWGDGQQEEAAYA